MAPTTSPQSAAINAALDELTSSGLSPTTFWLLLVFASASSAYFYVIPRFWPGSLINTTLQRCKEAQSRLKDIPLEHLIAERRALWDRICPESPDNFLGKVNKLRARNSKAWNDGILRLIGSLGELYKDACAVLEEMDEIELRLDELCL